MALGTKMDLDKLRKKTGKAMERFRRNREAFHFIHPGVNDVADDVIIPCILTVS